MARSEALGTVHEVTLPAGRVRYRERGEGPPVVYVHGLLVNADLWRAVVPPVAAAGFRCIAPDWPLGAHEAAARALPQFAKPVLLAWAEDDRLFPLAFAHRLAGLLPHATVATIEDSWAFVPDHQPALLARLVVDFARTHATT